MNLFPWHLCLPQAQQGVRQMFSSAEDEALRKLVEQYGDKDWKLIARKMQNRTTRQCRERYKNYLAPKIKNGPWSKDEDDLLRQKYQELGPKWSTIAGFFESRSDVNIKNRWTSLAGSNFKNSKFKAYIISNPAQRLPPQSQTLQRNENHGQMNPSSLDQFNPDKSVKNEANNDNSSQKAVGANGNDNPKIIINPNISSQPFQNSSCNNYTDGVNVSNCIQSAIPNLHGDMVTISSPSLSTQQNGCTQQAQLLSYSNNYPNSSGNSQSGSNAEVFGDINANVNTNVSPNVCTSANVNNSDNINNSNNDDNDNENENINGSDEMNNNDDKNCGNGHNDESNSNSLLPLAEQSTAMGGGGSQGKRKQLFPPISSLSQSADDRLYTDRSFIPAEARIDESFGSGALTNTFPNYGGNIW